MYRPASFAVDDSAVLHEVIRRRVFATIAIAREGQILFAYAPVVLDPAMGTHGGVRFHLALRNPLAEMEDGTRVAVSLLDADTYVSPDWYQTLVTVPTWNYIAVEGEGRVRRLSQDDLRTLLVDLSAQEEANLAPKTPWLIAKVPEPRVTAMLNAIVGFALPFDRLEGKFKLSQDKNPDDMRGVIAGLEAHGDSARLTVAAAMRSRLPGQES
jgi:transcriptional regulator